MSKDHKKGKDRDEPEDATSHFSSDELKSLRESARSAELTARTLEELGGKDSTKSINRDSLVSLLKAGEREAPRKRPKLFGIFKRTAKKDNDRTPVPKYPFDALPDEAFQSEVWEEIDEDPTAAVASRDLELIKNSVPSTDSNTSKKVFLGTSREKAKRLRSDDDVTGEAHKSNLYPSSALGAALGRAAISEATVEYSLLIEEEEQARRSSLQTSSVVSEPTMEHPVMDEEEVDGRQRSPEMEAAQDSIPSVEMKSVNATLDSDQKDLIEALGQDLLSGAQTIHDLSLSTQDAQGQGPKLSFSDIDNFDLNLPVSVRTPFHAQAPVDVASAHTTASSAHVLNPESLSVSPHALQQEQEEQEEQYPVLEEVDLFSELPEIQDPFSPNPASFSAGVSETFEEGDFGASQIVQVEEHHVAKTHDLMIKPESSREWLWVVVVVVFFCVLVALSLSTGL